jgi:plasmid maintenance system antidote protein VapI
MNEQPATLREWLRQHAARDIPSHRLARALGVRVQQVEELLRAAPTAETLLNLNRLAQYRYLALTSRVWPDCPWLAWDTKLIGSRLPLT